jgi:hypothetical protein
MMVMVRFVRLRCRDGWRLAACLRRLWLRLCLLGERGSRDAGYA